MCDGDAEDSTLFNSSDCSGNDMEKTVNKILHIFHAHGIRSGGVLSKKLMMDEIKTWPADEKMMVRDAWHTLVGHGLIQEGHPEGPILTPAGERAIYGGS